MRKATAVLVLVTLTMLGIPAGSAEVLECDRPATVGCSTAAIVSAAASDAVDRHELAGAARARADRTKGIRRVDWTDDAEFLRLLWLL